MNFLDKLKQAFPNNNIDEPKAIADIPADKFVVYILAINGSPIVAGHGKKNRAKVIFDSDECVTGSHIKAMKVRLYTLFRAELQFDRYLIQCGNKEEAKKVEAKVHREFGGNTLKLDDEMRSKLFDGVEERSPAWMALRMALCSSFDGISDLKKWRKDGILDDETWEIVVSKLKLNLSDKRAQE